MGHKKDYWERLRSWFLPKVGLVTQFLEDVTGQKFYVESETHNNRFVGRVDLGEEALEQVLHEMGFHRNPFSSYKSLGSGEDEEGSFRKIGFDNEQMQLHLLVYDGDKMDNNDTGVSYIYAHWEYRWDTNPIKHYRKVDASGPEGVKRMKDILNQYGVNYTLERPPQ